MLTFRSNFPFLPTLMKEFGTFSNRRIGCFIQMKHLWIVRRHQTSINCSGLFNGMSVFMMFYSGLWCFVIIFYFTVFMIFYLLANLGRALVLERWDKIRNKQTSQTDSILGLDQSYGASLQTRAACRDDI